MKKQSILLPLVGACLAAQPAQAQRADDNAVTSADDAFGKSVGDEQIGIYSPDNVRGFSPVSAGNLRIEGLYFDQQANPTDRLIDGATVRVGISAQSYPFPAPTGIGDYALRKPGKDFIVSIGANYGPFGGKLAEFDAQIPLDGERLGLVAGAGIYREGNPFGGTPHVESYAASLRWQPSAHVSIQPFWSRINVRDDESQTLIFTSGNFLPPRISRNQFKGQRWADFQGTLGNYGVVATAKPLGFDLQLGVFRSAVDVDKEHFDLAFGTDQSGIVSNRLLIGDRGNSYASTSGELRLSRSVSDGPRRHTVHASLRGRRLDRVYGGSDSASLGVSTITAPDFRAEPVFAVGPKTRDAVRQKTLGLGYELRWRDLGELSLGVQKTNYRKRVTDPDPRVVIPETRDSPWLFNATAAVYLSADVALYAGYTRGLEESDVAPSNAVNLNEAPPAIRTRQKDAGIRWRIKQGLTAVVGYFDVSKPYFNLDSTSRFRQLGQVRHQGLELSIAGEVAKGLTLVAGTVLLDATVSGDEVSRGLIGPKPVGTFKRHNIANLNWQLPWHAPLTLTARFEATSNRTANAANTLLIPARSVTSLGARYRMKVGGVQTLLRVNVDNIFNKFGWNVGGSGFFVPNGSRRYTLALAADL